MQAWQISSKWKKYIPISSEKLTRVSNPLQQTYQQDRVRPRKSASVVDRKQWRTPSKVVPRQPGCLRGLQSHKSGGRKPGLPMVPGPAWFSNLTVKVRAQLPWKHAGTPFPLQVPLPLWLSAKVLNHLAMSQWHSPPQLCWKRRGSSMCPGNKGTCNWSGHQRGWQPSSKQSQFL